MRKAISISALFFFLALGASAQNDAKGPNAPLSAAAPKTAAPSPQPTDVDGIAARIGNDVLTNSEVRELEDYQKLLEGRAQDRAKVMDELIDQWIVETEAVTTKFPHPSAADVTAEFQALLKEFPSRKEFQARLAQTGLTQDQVRDILERQLYYARFLSYRFHAATQVTASQIQAYYQQELVPQLQKRGVTVPPVNQVEAQIRQLLTQEEINEKASQWLDQAKARLRIVIQPPGGGG
jgi:hypothetical protein